MTDWYKARCRENEAGAILIIYALILTTMIALAGFAVDFTRWSRIGTMEQRAADAAALAGAVYMPDDFAGAQTAALAQASKNGFTNGANSTSIVVARGVRNNQLRVTISRQITNIFGNIIGVPKTTITKEALAEYQRTVNMGSPSNQFGNNPEAGTINATTFPNFWGSIAGPNTDKVQGDAISSKPCTSSGTSASDNCGSSLNTEFDSKGYYYGVDVLAGATGTLTFNAFDPAFAEVGGKCPSDSNGSNLSGAAGLSSGQVQHYPASSITPATRYGTYSDSTASKRYCSGDQGYTTSSYTPTWTTYVVREPDSSPWDPTDNPVLCAKDFPGYNGDLRSALLQTSFFPSGAPSYFAEFFRQWVNLCTDTTPTVGTYFIQITTSTKADGTAAPNGSGQNRFALTAKLNGLDSNLVHAYGEGRMSIYANFDGSTAVLPLARIMPGASGRTIELSLFDAGDLQGTGTIQVKPAPDAKNNGLTLSTFSGCTYTQPPGNPAGPPYGTFTATNSGCTVPNVSSSTFQGDWVSIRIPIPSTYTCDTTTTTGCWATVNYNFSGATEVTDTTTWTARIRGIPVRLIE